MKATCLIYPLFMLLACLGLRAQAQEDNIWQQADTEVREGNFILQNHITLRYKIGKRYTGYNHYQTAVIVELIKNKTVLHTQELHNGISDAWPVVTQKGTTLYLQLTYFPIPSDKPTYKQCCWHIKKNRLTPCR